MLTSTLVSPNAVKLLLPSSNSKTMAKQTTTIYINDQFQYFVNENMVTKNQLEDNIYQNISGETEASIVLRADQSVPVQYVVDVIDAVNNINKKHTSKHKVILATKPR